MSGAPDPQNFSVNERADEYEVVFRFSGELTQNIRATSPEEARQSADAFIAAGDFDVMPEEIDDISVWFVRKCPPMYRVIRDGRAMQVSRLQSGDLPRQPDEHGF